MSLSAIDCVGRGVANLRANWELVLLQLVQTLVCSVLAVVGAIGLVLLLGASFILELGSARDWTGAMERIEGLSINGGLLAIVLAATAILITVVGLIYSWFQAGIVTTLERGERQAPLIARVEPGLFRTFVGRNFIGWSHRGAWPFFGLFCLLVLCAIAVVSIYVVCVGLALGAFGQADPTDAAFAGCLAMLPLGAFLLLFNLWFLLSMALLARDGGTVLRAARGGLTVLGQRLGGALLVFLLFVIATLVVGLIFFPLGQGMSSALESSTGASLAVQFLLTIAQWLVNGILTVGLFASLVALARTESVEGRVG